MGSLHQTDSFLFTVEEFAKEEKRLLQALESVRSAFFVDRVPSC